MAEYLIRFVFGGVGTVAAALIAKEFGPGIGRPVPGLSYRLPRNRDTDRFA